MCGITFYRIFFLFFIVCHLPHPFLPVVSFLYSFIGDSLNLLHISLNHKSFVSFYFALFDPIWFRSVLATSALNNHDQFSSQISYIFMLPCYIFSYNFVNFIFFFFLQYCSTLLMVGTAIRSRKREKGNVLNLISCHISLYTNHFFLLTF